MGPVTLLIVGAGSRGAGYARFAEEFPQRAKVVGVAEPRQDRLRRLAEAHQVPPEGIFTCWSQAAGRPRLADAVFICTPDALHAEPAVAFARRGYQVLLEKPMAPNEADCRRIVRAAGEAGVILAVGHVMRYTAYTRTLKQLADSGAIGEVVSIQHLEPVGWWHQAHSFVRGNWRNEAQSSSMLLAKSCHDLDWLRHMMGVPCRRVSSFGSLHHFRKANQPAGAAGRCLDCSVEPDCPYSARKIYLDRLARGQTGWPLDVLATEVNETAILATLRDGPYGRCVYDCDNDAVDHQVVNLEFADGRTAAFTMTAFNAGGGRKTRLFGTRGEIQGDGSTITVFDFLTRQLRQVALLADDGSILSGHGGGDYALMDAFLTAVATHDPTKVLSGPLETLESHLIVFAAERARREGRVVDVPACEDAV